jgi:hypothetical protein
VRALAIYPPQRDLLLPMSLDLKGGNPTPEGGLPGTSLRDVRLGEVMAAVRRSQRALQRAGRFGLFPPTAPAPGIAIEQEEFADIAERYLDAYEAQPRRPLMAMLEQYQSEGWTGLTRDNVRDRVHLARKHGFLTPGRAGHAGAEPTAKLLEYRRSLNERREK